MACSQKVYITTLCLDNFQLALGILDFLLLKLIILHCRWLAVNSPASSVTALMLSMQGGWTWNECVSVSYNGCLYPYSTPDQKIRKQN